MKTIQTEEFRDIPGYEGIYQVSNLGRVKSLSRIDSTGRRQKERILKAANTRGYLIVTLSGKRFYAHQLVAIAFLNHTIDGHKIVVDHIDHDKTNNNVSNLRLVTHRENLSHRKKKGTSKYTGVSKHGNKWASKISVEGELIYLGLFDTELLAHEAYQNKLKIVNQLLAA